jgi:hypothetical protein
MCQQDFKDWRRDEFTGLGNASATLLLVDLNYSDLLKSLQDLAVDRARGGNVMARSGTSVLGASVNLAQAAPLRRVRFAEGLTTFIPNDS